MTKGLETGVPTRTCVGCGARDRQSRMIRLRQADAGAVVPASQIRTGRSAYVHSNTDCVRGLLRSKGLGKSLRTTITRPARLELMRILEERLTGVSSQAPNAAV